MNQQLPPTNNSYLPMNNLQTETLGNISPTNKTKDNGTKDETTKSSQSSVLNLLHTTQGYPGPNSNNENLGFGDENAMFSTNYFSNKRTPTYKDMFGDKQNSDNKNDKPEDFSGNFSGMPSRAPTGNPSEVHPEMEDHLDHLDHLVGQMVIQKVTLK